MIFQGNGAPLMPGQDPGQMTEPKKPADGLLSDNGCLITENVCLGYDDFSSLEIAEAISSVTGQGLNQHQGFVREIRAILRDVYQDRDFESNSITLSRRTADGITQNIRIRQMEEKRQNFGY
jgi:hypothetical protein